MNINGLKKGISSNRKLSDVLFIFWAGGAALLSYSLVYALRKPFTAATFDGLDFFGMDYKTVTSIVQIFGYFLSKLIGIKVISELKKENREYEKFLSDLSTEQRNFLENYMDIVDHAHFQEQQRAYYQGIVDAVQILAGLGIVKESVKVKELLNTIMK